MKEIVFAGSGGQGVLTCGLIVSDIAASKGMKVTWVPSYGSAMRGGTANCTVKYGPEQIYNPSQEAPDLLAEYAASADLALTDPEAAAPLAAEAGLTADPETALAAIPDCGLTFLTGADMRGAVQSFFEVLAGQDPAAIGGSIPDDAFYYIP